MIRSNPFCVQIRGAGLTGSLAALAFADSGWTVYLEDPLTIEQLENRSRAYALTHSSRRLLENLNLWNPLQEHITPFKWLTLRDQEINKESLFGLDDLPQQPSQAIGWTIQHKPLMRLILTRLSEVSVNIMLGSKVSEPFTNDNASHNKINSLVLACEGIQSNTRKNLGIGIWSFMYRQACLTAIVKLRGGHPDEAFELFRAEGPFAILPLGNDNFQIVWSTSQKRSRQLESMDSVSFLDALASVLPNEIQPSALIDQPRVFPVGWSLVHRLRKGKVIFVGEVAHRSHPVGGQGLNLCWRDVELLYQLALQVKSGKIKEHALASTYARRRWIDTLSTLLITDFLVRLFSNRALPLLVIRRLMLSSFNRIPSLRRMILSIMTEGPKFLNYFQSVPNDYSNACQPTTNKYF